MSDVILYNVQQLRQRAKEGTLRLEDTKAAIAAIRAERGQASVVSAKSTATKKEAKAKAAPVSSAALLSQLEGL